MESPLHELGGVREQRVGCNVVRFRRPTIQTERYVLGPEVLGPEPLSVARTQEYMRSNRSALRHLGLQNDDLGLLATVCDSATSAVATAAGEALATTQRIAAAVPGGKCAQVTQLLEGAENALRNTANPEDARALRVEVAKWQGELAALRLADGQGEGARAFRRRCTHDLRGNAAQVLCRRRFAAGRSSASAPFDWLCRTSTWRGRSGCSGCIPSGRHPRRHHGRRRHSPVSRHSPARSRVS